VGRLLLAALIEQCAASGLRQMVAVIGDQNSQPSMRLHAAMGFAHSGLIRSAGFKQGRWLDQVLMQRPLGPGDGQVPPSLSWRATSRANSASSSECSCQKFPSFSGLRSP
jgi:hypothetical protein